MVILKLAFSALVLVLVVVSLLGIWKDDVKTPMAKILWTLGVLIFPVVGSLAWLFIGRK